MLFILKVISLTGACSSLVVAAPCSVGVDVVGRSKSDSILVSAKAVLTFSVISPSCFLPSWSGFQVALLFVCLLKVQHTLQASLTFLWL